MPLYLGLMSGTSADAVDAVIAEIGSGAGILLRATHHHPMPPPLRRDILRLVERPRTSLSRLGALHVRVGRLFAEAAHAVLASAGIDPGAITAIGSHGQTVFHRPRGANPHTLQLGDPNVIAEMTGIATVADFRGRDIAAGGQGAPLVPPFHQRVFGTPEEARVVVNLGGIANVTLLPPVGEGEVRGFDTGPANVLLDLWSASRLGQPMDRDARWSRTGRVHPPLLRAALADPFFRRPPPKSTGREHFNLAWLERLLAALPVEIEAADVARTLCELTVRSVATAIEEHMPASRAVFVCGGGAQNPLVMEGLATALAPRRVDSTLALGVAPEWVEAAAFAWLAHQRVLGLEGNLPSVTGARHPCVLGGLFSGAC